MLNLNAIACTFQPQDSAARGIGLWMSCLQDDAGRQLYARE